MAYNLPSALELLSFWSFIGDATVQPTNWGANNKTFFVESPAGKFILKLYGDSTTAHIHYEHSILLYLQACDLSFGIPVPILTDSGETLVILNKNDIPLRLALFPLLAGLPANRNNIDCTRAAGKALSELHLALADFDLLGELAQLPSWGDLYRIHPLLKNPFEISHLLRLNSNEERRFANMLTSVIEAKHFLYKSLPVQTIHADYLSPNILVENNRVSGVLDFEFATKDLRLIDYICGIDHFGLFPWQQDPHWDLVRAFSLGYRENISISKPEVEAIAITWRLQRLSSIIYWTGWFLEGKVTQQSVVKAVSETLLFEDWLIENETELLACLFV